MHRQRPLPVGGAKAVGAGVAAADDHDALAFGGDDVGRRDVVASPAVDSAGSDTRPRSECRRAPGRESGGPAPRRSRQQRTMASNWRRRLATGRSTPISTLVRNSTPSSLHQRQPAIDEALLELELGNAVAQQAADAVGSLEHGDVMPGLVELDRRRRARPGRSRRRPPACRSARPAAAPESTRLRTRARRSTARST